MCRLSGVVHPVDQIEASRLLPPCGSFKGLTRPAETHLPVTFLATTGRDVIIPVIVMVMLARDRWDEIFMAASVALGRKSGENAAAVNAHESPDAVI